MRAISLQVFGTCENVTEAQEVLRQWQSDFIVSHYDKHTVKKRRVGVVCLKRSRVARDCASMS